MSRVFNPTPIQTYRSTGRAGRLYQALPYNRFGMHVTKLLSAVRYTYVYRLVPLALSTAYWFIYTTISTSRSLFFVLK